MSINISSLSNTLKTGITALAKYGYLTIGESGIPVTANMGETIRIEKNADGIRITYDTTAHFYMALARSIGMTAGTQTIVPKVKDLGLMLDCSRNAVAKPDMVKRLIGLLVLAGYNYLELYTEETYALPDEPYFGYKRGRYSAEELKEIVAFAGIFGIEMVPCIQTLAHLGSLFNWKPYNDHKDIDDILMVGDEAVYTLIRKCLRFCKEIFRTNRINIGTDEAFHLGRGNYIEKNGYHPKHEIYMEHLKRVFALCKEEGLEPEFWGDALYYTERITEEEKALFDGTQTPIYWDYYTTDIGYHRDRFKNLKGYAGKVMYAGGLWRWVGFAPENAYSNRIHDAAFQAAEEYGVDNILMTSWGDNGNECSVYATIPSMWYAADKLYPCSADTNKIVQKITGYSSDEWQICDRLKYALPQSNTISNADKFLFYNDFLVGLMDYHIPERAGEIYRELLPQLEELAKRDSSFAYIFRSYVELCRVLMNKATFGKRLYQAYQSHDRVMMTALIEELQVIQADLRSFYDAFRTLWMTENKGFGFEVQDVRIGGLIGRIDTVTLLLSDYLTGKTDRIYELEEERIDWWCGQLTGDDVYTPLHYDWSTVYTANHI